MLKRFFISVALAFALTGASRSEETFKPLRVLLVAGGCCHDYEQQPLIISAGLAERLNVDVRVEALPEKAKNEFPIFKKEGWEKDFDVVIHHECNARVKNQEYVERILKVHRAGMPLVALHCAMHSFRGDRFREPLKPGDPDAGWFDILGLQSSAHGPKLPITLTVLDEKHPITLGMEGWTTGNEELYNNVHGPEGNFVNWRSAKPLIQGVQEAGDEPGKNRAVVAWTNLHGEKKTKVFGTTLGHFNETVSDARYLDLVARGLLWVTDRLGDDGKPKAGYGAK